MKNKNNVGDYGNMSHYMSHYYESYESYQIEARSIIELIEHDVSPYQKPDQALHPQFHDVSLDHLRLIHPILKGKELALKTV